MFSPRLPIPFGWPMSCAVTEATFHQKLAELATSIDAKFGKLHPTAKRPRLEPEAAQR